MVVWAVTVSISGLCLSSLDTVCEGAFCNQRQSQCVPKRHPFGGHVPAPSWPLFFRKGSCPHKETNWWTQEHNHTLTQMKTYTQHVNKGKAAEQSHAHQRHHTGFMASLCKGTLSKILLEITIHATLIYQTVLWGQLWEWKAELHYSTPMKEKFFTWQSPCKSRIN